MEPPPRPSSSSLFQVYLRLKPPTAPSLSTTQASIFYPNLHPTERYLTVEEPTNGDVANPTHITVVPPKDSRKRAIEKFAFTKVFQEDAAQLDIFKGTGIIPLIEGVLGANAKNGRDGLFATLGVTGSGKSHTMLGSSSQRGLTQLSLDVLFRSLGGSLLDPIASASTPQSLANSDAAEAQLLPAPVFLDGVYGEVRPDWGNSRAPTPMLVGTDISSPPHPSLQALYPSLLGVNAVNSPQARAQFFQSPILRNPFSRKKGPY